MSNHTHCTSRPCLTYITCTLALCLAGLPLSAAAQDAGATPRAPRESQTNPGPLVPFLEGTDVFFSLRQDTVFEADIVPHLIAFQNFDNVLDIDEQAARARSGRVKSFAISISGTPGVRLRMFESVSRPVRTPSYMPRGDVQFIWARNIGAFAAALGVPPSDNRVSLWEAHAVVGHHSNGQDGCFWDDEERIDEICTSVLPILDERRVNKRDGSFSTNFIRVGMNYRKNILDDTLWARREYGFRADFEYHPRGWVDDEMEDLYGRTRFEVAGTFASRELAWCPKRTEVTGGLKIIGGHPESVWPVAVTAQFSCFPAPMGGWGVFVRYYGGQDYYNLGLLDNIQRVHVGATFNQSGFFRFRRSNER